MPEALLTTLIVLEAIDISLAIILKASELYRGTGYQHEEGSNLDPADQDPAAETSSERGSYRTPRPRLVMRLLSASRSAASALYDIAQTAIHRARAFFKQ
ncbi:hypothetical protein TWF506_000020 [Arthrobotrys conoides]|uniref:Uncharacterized protein n=1 Tax=Arthrobotrys conoides TaxID=74498 RepID=A0AAN8S3Z4_9PEZI